MTYKFDILFRNTKSDGTIKVVTFRNLVENPQTFGLGVADRGYRRTGAR